MTSSLVRTSPGLEDSIIHHTYFSMHCNDVCPFYCETVNKVILNSINVLPYWNTSFMATESSVQIRLASSKPYWEFLTERSKPSLTVQEVAGTPHCSGCVSSWSRSSGLPAPRPDLYCTVAASTMLLEPCSGGMQWRHWQLHGHFDCCIFQMH